MMVRCFLTVSLFVAMSVSNLVWAAKVPEPKVDYSADSVMEAESHTLKGKIHYTPGKQRQEMGGDDGMVMIIRRDKQVIWQLMGDMYMEMPMGQSESNDLENMDVEQTVVGEETVNGIKTTKSKVIATMADGRKFGGFFWTTKEGITVKMDLLMKEGEKKDRIMMELSNLKIAKQDPKLFEPPPGAVKNDMGAMMGMGKGRAKGKAGMPSMEDMMKGMGGGEGAQGAEGMDMNKMMKDMMGR